MCRSRKLAPYERPVQPQRRLMRAPASPAPSPPLRTVREEDEDAAGSVGKGCGLVARSRGASLLHATPVMVGEGDAAVAVGEEGEPRHGGRSGRRRRWWWLGKRSPPPVVVGGAGGSWGRGHRHRWWLGKGPPPSSPSSPLRRSSAATRLPSSRAGEGGRRPSLGLGRAAGSGRRRGRVVGSRPWAGGVDSRVAAEWGCLVRVWRGLSRLYIVMGWAGPMMGRRG